MLSDATGSRSRGAEEPSSGGLGGQRVLITGASGQLGQFLLPAVSDLGATAIALGRQPGAGIDVAADLADREETLRALGDVTPDVIIHAAACTDVDGIERDPARGEASNARATRNIVEAAREVGAYLVAVSTDMVFPGDGGAPYEEDAPTSPISEYGRSKLAAERAVLEGDPAFAVARTAWLYGGAGKHFPRTVLAVLRDRGHIDVVDDEFGGPTFAADLALALAQLAAARGSGIFHLVNEGRASRFALARHMATLAGFDPEQVRPVSTAAFLEQYPLPARRPPDSTLHNRRAAALGITLRGWREALEAYAPVLAAEMRARAVAAPVGGG
ncbi:MAG: dTDP-4-dehydrorhamnose reductase [Thermomicrobiales bacterium]